MAVNKKKELVKNTSILTVGKICTQCLSFFLMPLYTAVLLPEQYGIVDLLTTYVSLLIPIVSGMTEQGLFRFLLDDRDDYKYASKIITTVFFVNVLQCIGFSALYVIVREVFNSPYKIFLWTNVVLNLFSGTFLQFARGKGHNLHYAIASFLSAITTIIGNIFGILVLKLGAYGLFYSIIAAQIVVIIYLLIAERIPYYIRITNFDKAVINNILKYSLPLVPANLSWWVVGVSDRTIVSAVLGVAVNGVYTVANKFSTIFVTFYNIFSLTWTESVSLYIESEDRDKYLTEVINTTVSLFAAACLGLIALMPFVFPLLINNNYQDAYNQIPILMLSVLFQVICGLYSAVYLAKKKSSESAKTAVFAAVINIGVDILLIKYIGLYAASISTLVAYASMAIYRYFDVKKYVKAVINTRFLLVTVLVATFELIAYYSKHRILSVVVLITVIVYSFYYNREFIVAICKGAVCAFKRGKNE